MKVVLLLVGNFPATVKLHKMIDRAGINYFHTGHFFLNKFTKFGDDRERSLFFHVAVRADRAGILAAMTGIEHNDIEFGV